MITTMIDKKPEERKRKLVTKHDEDMEVDGPSIPKKDKMTTKDKASSIEDRFHKFDDISQDEKVLRLLGKVEKKKKKHKRKKKNKHKEKTNKITESILKDKILYSNNESTSNKITKKRSLKKMNRREVGKQSYSELCSATSANKHDVKSPMKRDVKFKGNNKVNNPDGQSLKEQTQKHEIIVIEEDDVYSKGVKLPTTVPVLSNTIEHVIYDNEVELIACISRKSQQSGIKPLSKRNNRDAKKRKKGTSEFQQSIVIDSTSEEENIEISQQQNKKIGETRISQVAPVKAVRKKKKKEMKKQGKEMGLCTPEEGYEIVNQNRECSNKVEDERNIKTKRKKKKKEKDKDIGIDDVVEKNEEDKTIQANKELKEKAKEDEFDFETSMMEKLEKEKGNVAHGEISRINSLYAKEIPRHELLDHMRVTSAELDRNNVKFAKGRWTSHEMYILFKNIRTVKCNYDIKSFKDFMLPGGNKTDVTKATVYRDLAVQLLRPLLVVWKKLDEIYVTGEKDPDNRNKLYTVEENERLLYLVKKYRKDWKSISLGMGRSIKSCKCRYDKLKRANEIQMNRKDKGFGKLQRFSPQEDKLLLDTVKEFKRERKLVGRSEIPWVMVAKKIGTRCEQSCQQRLNTLLANKEKATKLSHAKKHALAIKVLRLLINQNIEELLDVNWKKLKVSVRFKGHWSVLKRYFTRFINANVDRALTTNQQRLDYLVANASKQVIQSAKKLPTET